MSLRRERGGVTGRERWTALTAAFALIVLALGLAAVRLPLVVWSAGGLVDLYAGDDKTQLGVSGVVTYGTSGKLQVAGVAVGGQTVSLARALRAFYLPNEAVMPQAVNYPVGLPIGQVAVGVTTQEALRATEAAALRAAGMPVERAPRVVSVMSSGPSYGLLQPDDVREGVGSTSVTSVADFNQALILNYSVGDTVQLAITRGGVRLENQVDVVAQASNNEQQTPSLGVVLTDSFLLGSVEVHGAPTDIGSGLMLALGIYDLVTPGNLLGGKSVAGSGMVDANGVVSSVAGAVERLQAAQAAGVDIYLLPRSSCANVSLGTSPMIVLAVGSLADAIDGIRMVVAGGPAKQVYSCPSG